MGGLTDTHKQRGRTRGGPPPPIEILRGPRLRC
jgi:hypothetical protein